MQHYNNGVLFGYGQQAPMYDPSTFQQPPSPLTNYDVSHFQDGYLMAPAPIPVYYQQYDAIAPPQNGNDDQFGTAVAPMDSNGEAILPYIPENGIGAVPSTEYGPNYQSGSTVPPQQQQLTMDMNGEPEWFNNMEAIPTEPFENIDEFHNAPVAPSDTIFNPPTAPLHATLTHPPISVGLENQSLWQEFDKIGNEMKVTNDGKKLFPFLAYKVSGLKRGAYYKFDLKMHRVLPHALKWNPKEQCFEAGSTQDAGEEVSNVISTGIMAGEGWEQEGINFVDVNIHNIGDPKKKGDAKRIDVEEKKARRAGKKKENKEKLEKICLTLNCRYQPVLTVIEVSEQNGVLAFIPLGDIVFEETVFTCVADYRNQKVNTLKTAHNPSCSKGNKENAKKTLEEQASGVTSINKNRKRKAPKEAAGVKRRRNPGYDSGYSSQSSNVTSAVPTPSGTPPLSYSQYYGWDGSAPSTSGC